MADKISITLPSLKPFHLKRTVFEIQENTSVEYEIIIVSPFEVAGKNIKWIPESGERNGSGPAHAVAYQNATGNFITLLTDDVLPLPGWAENLIEYVNNKEKLLFPFAAGFIYQRTAHLPHAPVSFGSGYGRYFPFFPFMSRQSVEAVGGWILPEFRRGCADTDLGMRIWHAGGACYQCMKARVLTAQLAVVYENALDVNRDMSDQLPDFERFIEKWEPIFGHGWPREFTKVIRNHNFNELIDGTYFKPDP
jgi:GT2 family glycosyltransferase